MTLGWALVMALGSGTSRGTEAERRPFGPYDCTGWMDLIDVHAKIATLRAQPRTVRRDEALADLRVEAAKLRYELYAKPTPAARRERRRPVRWAPAEKPWALDVSEELTQQLENRLQVTFGIDDPTPLIDGMNLRVNLSKQLRAPGSVYAKELSDAGFTTREQQLLAAELLGRYRPYSRRFAVHQAKELEELKALLAEPAARVLAVDDDPWRYGGPLVATEISAAAAVELIATRRLGRPVDQMRRDLNGLANRKGREGLSFGEALLAYLKATDPLYYVVDLNGAYRFLRGSSETE